MKFNAFFAAAIAAGALFTSCVHQTAQERQLKYTHVTLVDGDAFAALQKVGETAHTGIQYAEQAEVSGSAESKEAASKVKAFYAQLLPSLDNIATALQVDFPIKGVPAMAGDSAVAGDVDSTVAVEDVHIHPEEDYIHRAQHDIASLKEQLTRLTRNTNKELQDFAKKQLPAVNELYTQIGGKEEAHGHAHH